MNRTVLFVALLAASGSVFATPCRDGSDPSQHPEGNCDWFYRGTDPTRPAVLGTPSQSAAGSIAGSSAGSQVDTRVIVDASGAPITAEQRQQQQQRMQQGQTLENRNAASAAGGGGGTGGSITFQGDQAGSGDSYKSVYTAWAPIVHGAGASAAPTASMGAIVIPCGPRQYLYEEDVMGAVIGPFGGITYTRLGSKTRSIPMSDIGGDSWLIEDIWETVVYPSGFKVRKVVGQIKKGHIIAGYGTVITTSLARSLSLGLYHEGSGGQGGAAGSSAMQQQTKDLTAFECEKEVRFILEQPKPAVTTVAVITPRPPKPPRTYRPRNVPPAAVPCCCTVVLPPSCSAPKSTVAVSR